MSYISLLLLYIYVHCGMNVIMETYSIMQCLGLEWCWGTETYCHVSLPLLWSNKQNWHNFLNFNLYHPVLIPHLKEQAL